MRRGKVNSKGGSDGCQLHKKPHVVFAFLFQVFFIQAFLEWYLAMQIVLV